MEDLAITTITITLVSKADVKFYTQRMRLQEITAGIREVADNWATSRYNIDYSFSVDGPWRMGREADEEY